MATAAVRSLTATRVVRACAWPSRDGGGVAVTTTTKPRSAKMVHNQCLAAVASRQVACTAREALESRTLGSKELSLVSAVLGSGRDDEGGWRRAGNERWQDFFPERSGRKFAAASTARMCGDGMPRLSRVHGHSDVRPQSSAHPADAPVQALTVACEHREESSHRRQQ